MCQVTKAEEFIYFVWDMLLETIFFVLFHFSLKFPSYKIHTKMCPWHFLLTKGFFYMDTSL